MKKKQAGRAVPAVPAEVAPPEVEEQEPDYSAMSLEELVKEKPGLREWLEQSDFAHMLEEEEEQI